MISQTCPRCSSKRIRRGYRPTSLWSKFLFRYNLLCDSCNWEFIGFAVPGTVSAKPTKRRKTDEKDEKAKNKIIEIEKPSSDKNKRRAADRSGSSKVKVRL